LTGNLAEIEYTHETSAWKPRAATIRLRPDALGLVRQKLEVPGNDLVDVSPDRFATLRPQLESQLKPVLRARAFATVAEVAAALGRTP
jgi:hypothetical protein